MRRLDESFSPRKREAPLDEVTRHERAVEVCRGCGPANAAGRPVSHALEGVVGLEQVAGLPPFGPAVAYEAVECRVRRMYGQRSEEAARDLAPQHGALSRER